MSHYAFEDLKNTSLRAAQRIVPRIIQLCDLAPTSIVDLGGGGGAWCKAFQDVGTKQVRCIDHPGTPKEMLWIKPEEFIPCNFEVETPQIVPVEMALSIEFAEHITPNRAEQIVAFLTASAKLVVFSAAIPGQGGVRHINEQRHDYWKQLFAKVGYTQLDIIRPLILFDREIPYYLRQNLFVYIHPSDKSYSKLCALPQLCSDEFELVAKEILMRKPSWSFLIKSLIQKILR